MTALRRLRVLANPAAGAGAGTRRLAEVSRRLAAHGLEPQVARTESAAHAAELARAAAQAGEEVVAFGGDGMARIAAAAIRGTGAVLGVLPGGRGNDFAAALGIPRDPLGACEVLVSGKVIAIDLGEANGEVFLGNASIGLESEVTPIANAAPRLGGRAVYLAATIYGLAKWRPARFELDLDGLRRAYAGYLAAAANTGRFGGGMQLAPAARLDDGLLDVVMIEHTPPLKFLRGTPKVFRGTHVHEPNVHISRARRVRLDADRPFGVYADGDEITRTPAVVEVIPAALKVRVPHSPGSAKGQRR